MFTHSEADYETLVLLFRRASSLPELPGSALRLVHVIDTGSASAKDLDTVSFRRIRALAPICSESRTPVFPESPQTASRPSVRAAIMRLGQRSVRTLAVSLMLQQVTHGRDVAPDFHVDRFARHSLFVAFLAKYLFARRNMSEN